MDINTNKEVDNVIGNGQVRFAALKKELGKNDYFMLKMTKELCSKEEFFSKKNKRKFYSLSGANKLRAACRPVQDEPCDAPVAVREAVESPVAIVAPVVPVAPVAVMPLKTTGRVVRIAPNIRWAYAKIKECASLVLVFVPQKLRGRVLNKNVSVKIEANQTYSLT